MSEQPPERDRWDWRLPNPPEQPAARRVLEPQHDFRRAVVFTLAGAVAPGLGLIAARRRIIGGIILGAFLAALAGLGLYAALDLQGFLALAVNPTVLKRLAVALILIAVVWVGVIVATHLSLRSQPSRGQRVIGGVLVSVLAFAVAAPMAVAARYSYDQAGLVGAVFKSDKDSKSATRPTWTAQNPGNGSTIDQDPWAGKPRLNILLLGGDAGPGRTGTRTDTVILASIDTKTGDTTMFSLPRNTGRMPFPTDSPLRKDYPNGFTDGDGDDPEYFLNAMYDNVPNKVSKTILGETDDLGADVLKLSVGTALGLQVDYYMLIDLQGFSKMINALGGIRVNINTYIPIGGNTDRQIPPEDFLKPGANQKLNGRDALWYARGRYGSDDYARMDRQRCVINAIIKQANPRTMLSRYEDIAKAGKTIVYTDIPQEVLPLMVDLSLRVKDGNVRSIVFKNGVDGFVSFNPNFSQMRERVKVALGEAKVKTPSAPSTTTTAPAPAPAPTKKKETGPVSEDVDSSCAFNPKIAATARPYTG